MISQSKLSALSIFFFFVGVFVIMDYFSNEAADLTSVTSNPHSFESKNLVFYGFVSPSNIDLTEYASFEEEITTYELEKNGIKILLVYPGDISGFQRVEGKFFIPGSDIPNFLYGTDIRNAWRIEELGISRGGISVLTFYLLASATAFLYEFFSPKIRIN